MKQAYKDKLKKIKPIYKVNAFHKCRQLKKKYKSIIDYYDNKQSKNSFNELLLKKGISPEWGKQFQNKKPVIYYLGTDEFQDKSGFLQELNKIAEVYYFLKEDGAYGQYLHSYSNAKDLNGVIIEKKLEELYKSGKKIDILMMQSWGKVLDVPRLNKLKMKYKFKVINIGMDERLVYWGDNNNINNNTGISGLIPLCDLMLVTSPECVEWYHKEGVPSIYFPEASSLDFYYPMNLKKIYDVGFIGNKYGIREKIINSLIKDGINVRAHGNGWPAGRISLEKNNEFFNQCKIVLGIGTVGHCEDFYTLKLRDFDAPMSGSLYVTHKNPDLVNLFEPDKEMVFCKDVNEYKEKINYYLKNEDRLKAVADQGHKKAKEFHTYATRFEKLFKEIFIYQ